MLQNELKLTISPADKSSEYKCRGLNLRYDPIVEKNVRLEIAGEFQWPYNKVNEPDHIIYSSAFYSEDQAQVPFYAIIVPTNGTFKANESITIRCVAQGSRGPAIVTWWKGNHLLNESSVSATPGTSIIYASVHHSQAPMRQWLITVIRLP